MSHLLSELAKHMRSCSLKIDSSSESFGQYKALFQKLRQSFDVGIFNLNYDTAALTAMPGTYTGFADDGKFEPYAVHTRTEWDYLYHLHGSVHHSLIRENSDQICWRNDLTGEFFDSDGGMAPKSRSENRLFPVSTLLAGGFKLDQLLVEPFGSFHAAMIRHVHEANAIFIGGYGFGDAHVNWALRNRLSSSRERPPILIVDKREARALSSDDNWSTGLCTTMGVDETFFRHPDGSSDGPSSGMFAGEHCEIAEDHRVALLLGGFREAARAAEDISRWLCM